MSEGQHAQSSNVRGSSPTLGDELLGNGHGRGDLKMGRDDVMLRPTLGDELLGDGHGRGDLKKGRDDVMLRPTLGDELLGDGHGRGDLKKGRDDARSIAGFRGCLDNLHARTANTDGRTELAETVAPASIKRRRIRQALCMQVKLPS